MTAQDYTPWLFKSLNRKGLKLEDVSIPCVFAKGTSDFFNQDAVKTALHISDKAAAWQLCTENIKYTSGIGSLHLYEDLRVAGL